MASVRSHPAHNQAERSPTTISDQAGLRQQSLDAAPACVRSRICTCSPKNRIISDRKCGWCVVKSKWLGCERDGAGRRFERHRRLASFRSFVATLIPRLGHALSGWRVSVANWHTLSPSYKRLKIIGGIRPKGTGGAWLEKSLTTVPQVGLPEFRRATKKEKKPGLSKKPGF